MAPLSQFLVVADDLEFWVAKDVVSMVVKDIGHLSPAANGFGDFKYSFSSPE